MNLSLNSDTTLVMQNVRQSAPGPCPAAVVSAGVLALSDHENRLHFFDRFAKAPGARDAGLTLSSSEAE
jgi:hypothetical protein